MSMNRYLTTQEHHMSIAYTREWLLCSFTHRQEANVPSYLQSVNLGTAPPTTAQLTQIQTLTDALSAAQDKFDTQSNIAYGKFLVS
jgi:hypothetical protein